MKLRELYQKKSDLHAHSLFSDGTLNIADSIERRKKYASLLGISDHYQYIKDVLDNYVLAVREQQEIYNAQNIEVKLGVEIYLSDIEAALEDLLVMDFIIIEKFETYIYQEHVITVITNLIRYLKEHDKKPEIILAHPRFGFWFGLLERSVSINDMLQFLVENDIAIEINCNSGYFFKTGYDFRELIKDKSNLVVNKLIDNKSLLSIGSDAHAYEDILFSRFLTAYNIFEGM